MADIMGAFKKDKAAMKMARLEAELERAKEALIFEWAKSAEGCWLSDVVNVRHEAAARYEREIGYE